MVKLRLKRTGATKKPMYRLVAADSRMPRDGRFIEILGYYNPRTTPVTVNFDEEKIIKWLQAGAQPSDTVKSILSKQGVIKKFVEGKKA